MKKIVIYLCLTLTTTHQLMSQAANNKKTGQKEITISFLQSFADAFNAHDVNAILSFMTDDCIFEASAGPDADGEKFTGKEAVKKAFEEVFKIYPDARWGNARHFIVVIVAFPNGYLQAQKQMAAKWRLPAVICLPSAMVK